MENWALSDAYRAKRERIDAAFTPEARVVPSTIEAVSLSGHFVLIVQQYKPDPKAWCYSRGIVTAAVDGDVVADVKRNYGLFPNAFICHPDGREYLICGEDYQGQTVINLHTKERVDYASPLAAKGGGFCWAVIEWKPEDPCKLFVSGCLWAGPYEAHVYDITDPMVLPYPLLSCRYECEDEEPEDDDEED